MARDRHDAKALDVATRTDEGRRYHEVPLSPLAIAVIEECPKLSDFVFSTGGDRPISGWSKAKSALDEKSKIADWRLHDLRRTCATRIPQNSALIAS